MVKTRDGRNLAVEDERRAYDGFIQPGARGLRVPTGYNAFNATPGSGSATRKTGQGPCRASITMRCDAIREETPRRRGRKTILMRPALPHLPSQTISDL